MFNMRTTISLALAFASLAFAQSGSNGTVHNVEVGPNSTLTYSPSNITANPGDTVLFTFNPMNHTVTQSNFKNPCESLQESTGTVGFKSGFLPVSANTPENQKPTFSIKINDTNPIWVYCGQTLHCQKGMVFAVNAPSTGNTFQAFQALAMNSSSTTSSSSAAGSAGASATATATGSANGAAGSGSPTGSNSAAPTSTDDGTGINGAVSTSVSFGLTSVLAVVGFVLSQL